jgi:hypothetical protein
MLLTGHAVISQILRAVPELKWILHSFSSDAAKQQKQGFRNVAIRSFIWMVL